MNSVGLQRRVAMTLGRETCDFALVHADVVDVFGRTVLPDQTVLAGDGRVLAVLDYALCPAPKARKVYDCQRRPLMPGLMDAHVHIESTLLTPEHFASTVVACGTTCVVADPHEIANVAGTNGIAYMFGASEDLPVRVLMALPSCVPCTPFEDGGASLAAEDLKAFYAHERVCSLAELMNYPGALNLDTGIMAKVGDALSTGHIVDGHCPGLTGLELAAYAGCGVANDHEEIEPEKLLEHVRSGLYVFLRAGSHVAGLERMLSVVTPANAHRFCFCTDDLHVGDIVNRGHINATLAAAVACGLDAPTAVAMATLHPAQCYRLWDTGAVAPGYRADLVLMEDLRDFKPVRVWSEGRIVAENGVAAPIRATFPVPDEIMHSVHLGDVSEESLRLPVPSGRARIIGILPGQIFTEERIADVVVDVRGDFDTAANPGLCKIAVIERHKGLGRCGVGILDGYVRPGCQLGGAIATSISHDSHNIVVAGSSDADMIAAVRAVAAMGGGVALVRDGALTASMPLPVGGLMTLEDVGTAARLQETVNSAARALAVSDDVDPLILIFMSLCVIPSLKINTRGLFDVNAFCFVGADAGEAATGTR